MKRTAAGLLCAKLSWYLVLVRTDPVLVRVSFPDTLKLFRGKRNVYPGCRCVLAKCHAG